MKIAITGSTGFIGSALTASLSRAGHAVTRIARPQTRLLGWTGPTTRWDPSAGTIDTVGLEGQDAVIHLAGARIGRWPWTERWKQEILETRRAGTTLLARTLAGLQRPPRVLLAASAIGYYGIRDPGEAVEESAGPGATFLAGVVQAWEGATALAREAGIRVLNMRSANVLGPGGGFLAPFLLPWKLGLGARFGSGRQIISWVALADYLQIVNFLLDRGDLRGPVNIAAPNAVSNAEFTRILARVLRRPAVFVIPGFALRLALGELAGEILGGVRVVPGKLLNAGYRFTHPDLEGALRHIPWRNPGTAV